MGVCRAGGHALGRVCIVSDSAETPFQLLGEICLGDGGNLCGVFGGRLVEHHLSGADDAAGRIHVGQLFAVLLVYPYLCRDAVWRIGLLRGVGNYQPAGGS